MTGTTGHPVPWSSGCRPERAATDTQETALSDNPYAPPSEPSTASAPAPGTAPIPAPPLTSAPLTAYSGPPIGQVGKVRNTGACVLPSIVTAGIYPFVWYYTVTTR